MPNAEAPIEVFCSYAHEDESLLEELKKHLSGLQGRISVWHDRQIKAGTNWVQATDTRLNSASVILLLISADFLASDYCSGVEMKRALERHQANEARVVSILLRPVDWKDAPFAHLQPLPTDGKAITTWINRDEAFVDVVTGIRRALDDLSVLAASTPRATQSTIWNIPYPRNSFFTGRDDLLKRLHKQLQAGQTTALSQPQAISGLGGIGKTQIAVEYAYRYRQEYEVVLWASAETQESLTSSYNTIATLLKLPEREASEQEIIIQAVKRWLQTNGNWLLILDNADDLDLLPPLLPPEMGGHLLLTTRAWNIPRRARRIEVETLPTEQGATFLLRRAGLLATDAELSQALESEQTLALQLAHEMGGLPLALEQAGAFLEATGMSLEQYQQVYRRHLLQEQQERDPDHPKPVATTWSLSFARVEQKSPAAADLLRLCAFLSPDAIAEEILTEGASELGPTLESVVGDPLLLSQAIEALRAYSLVRRDPRARTLSVHRLVQVVLQDGMDEEGRKQWAERAVCAVNRAFPEVKHQTWPQCDRLVPHTLVCAELIKGRNMQLPEAGRLLTRAGWYLKERAQYVQAASLLRQGLAIREKVLEPEHLDIAQSLNELGRLYTIQRKDAKAELLLKRGLAIREKVRGPEHSDVAKSLNNLALLYTDQGKYREAEPLYQRALSIREQHLGPQHNETAISLNNLASLYQTQGKYVQAEPLYRRTLTICEQQLGANHPNTATSLNNLAVLYENQGKYTDAESLCKRALAIRERQLGPDHPDTANSLNNLAGLYKSQGKFQEAEPLYLRALQISERLLGPEHPSTANSLNNLAELYRAQGKYAQAEPLYQRALSITEQQLGPDHPFTATSLNNLATLYDTQGKYSEAEPLYRRALAIKEQKLGVAHPSTQLTRRNYASLVRKLGRDEEANALEAPPPPSL